MRKYRQKHTVSEIRGKFYVSKGSEYWPSSESETKPEALLKAIAYDAAWLQAALDQLQESFEDLADRANIDANFRDYLS